MHFMLFTCQRMFPSVLVFGSAFFYSSNRILRLKRLNRLGFRRTFARVCRGLNRFVAGFFPFTLQLIVSIETFKSEVHFNFKHRILNSSWIDKSITDPFKTVYQVNGCVVLLTVIFKENTIRTEYLNLFCAFHSIEFEINLTFSDGFVLLTLIRAMESLHIEQE